MKLTSTKSIYLLTAFLLLSTLNYGQGVNLQEDFTGEISGWTFKNNSRPQTAGDGDWSVSGGPQGYVGPGVGDPPINAAAVFNVGTTLLGGAGAVITQYGVINYKYASVGYTEDDYDSAHISKWMISPLLKGIKNGDKIRFWTRERTVDATDRLSAAIAKDPNGMLDCNTDQIDWKYV